VIEDDVQNPAPECEGVPLLDLEIHPKLLGMLDDRRLINDNVLLRNAVSRAT